MGEIFAVTSGKGGVGKSTVSVGISSALAATSDKVLLIDMDLGLRCLDLMLGVSGKLVFDINDVLSGGADLQSAVLDVDCCKGLQLLAAAYDEGGISSDVFGDFIEKNRELYDYIVIDFPAGIELSMYKVLPKDTLFITVCNPDPVSIRDASFMADKISQFSDNKRLIINKFDLKQVKNGKCANIDEIIDTSSTRLLGLVPFDKKLPVLSANGKTLKRGKTYKAFVRIARRLKQENTPLPRLKKI